MDFAGPAAASAAGRSWARHWWGLAPDPEMIAVATAAVDEALAARGLPPLSAPVTTVDVCPALLQSPTALPATSMRYVPFSGATRRPDWLLAEPVTPQVCLTLGTLLPRRDPQQSEIWRLVLRVLAELDHEVVVAIGRKHVPLLGELPHGVRAEPVPLSGLLRVVVGDGPPRTAVRDLAQENRSRPSPDAVAADLAASVGAPGPERSG